MTVVILVHNNYKSSKGRGGELTKIVIFPQFLDYFYVCVFVGQGRILTVILASRMTGNHQISGEISGQNHAPLCREWVLVKITHYLCREWGFISSENKRM